MPQYFYAAPFGLSTLTWRRLGLAPGRAKPGRTHRTRVRKGFEAIALG